MTTAQDRLNSILPSWYELLSQWSLDGSLVAAAIDALVLDSMNAKEDAQGQLQSLVSQWSVRDFSALPPIVLLSDGDISGAQGAYAASTGTIYLNEEWLLTASDEEIQRVLAEELGHSLDDKLNVTDTKGDEGQLFSAKLLDVVLTDSQIAPIQAEDDTILIAVDGLAIEAEANAGQPDSFYYWNKKVRHDTSLYFNAYSDKVYNTVEVYQAVGLTLGPAVLQYNPYSEIEFSKTIVIESTRLADGSQPQRIVYKGNFVFNPDTGELSKTLSSISELLIVSPSAASSIILVELESPINLLDYENTSSSYWRSLGSGLISIPDEYSPYFEAYWELEPFSRDLVSVNDAVDAPGITSNLQATPGPGGSQLRYLDYSEFSSGYYYNKQYLTENGFADFDIQIRLDGILTSASALGYETDDYGIFASSNSSRTGFWIQSPVSDARTELFLDLGTAETTGDGYFIINAFTLSNGTIQFVTPNDGLGGRDLYFGYAIDTSTSVVDPNIDLDNNINSGVWQISPNPAYGGTFFSGTSGLISTYLPIFDQVYSNNNVLFGYSQIKSRKGYAITLDTPAATPFFISNSTGAIYSDASTASWDAKGARAFGTGYQVLLDGTGTYAGKGLVWTTNSAGVITGSSGWLSAERLWQWESAFGVELNDDGTTGYAAVDVVGGRLVRPIGAVYGGTYYIDRDGDVDTDDLLKLRNSEGVSYRDSSSGSWDAKGARAFGTGYQVLLDGTGTYAGKGLVWTTNSAGVITGSSGWLSAERLWQWESAFGVELNDDGTTGYAAVDVVGGRLVRPIGAVYGGTYYIDRDGDVDTDDLLKLRNRDGVSYRDSSSGSWDAKGARAFGTGYQVLLDGTGAYEGQGLVWTTNSAGVITGSSGWLSGQSLWTWEDAFGFDVNADGALGDPNAYQPNPLLPIRTDLLETTYLTSKTDYRTSTTIESSGSRTDSFSYSYDYQYLLDAQDRPLAVKRDTIQLDSTYTQSGPDYVDYFYYIYGPSGIAVAEFFAEDNREGYIANPVELRRIVTVNVLDGGLIAAEKLVFSQGSLYAGSFGQSLSLSEAVGYRYESGPNGGIFNEAIENLPWPDPTTFDASVEIFGGVRQITYTSTPMSFYDGRLVVTETGDSIGYDAVVFNPPSGDDEAGISFSVDLYEGGSDSLLRWLRSDVLFDSPSSALEIISGAYLNVFGAAEPSDSLLASRLVSQGSYGIGDDPYSRSVVYQYDSLTGLMTGFSESYRSEDPFGSYSSQTNIQATYSTGLSAEAQLIPDSSLLDAMSTQLAQTALLQFQWTPEQGLLFADLYTGL